MLRVDCDSQRHVDGGHGLLACRSQLLKWEGFLECAVSACGTGAVPVLLAETSLGRQAEERCAKHEGGWEDGALRFEHAPRAYTYPHDRTDEVRSVRCSFGAHGRAQGVQGHRG